MKNISFWICLLMTTGISSCCPCDLFFEDNDDCVQEEQFTIEYSLHLVTNIEVELNTVLYTQTNQIVANRLREDLTQDIFREYAKDINLSFYDYYTNILDTQEVKTMNDKEKSYIINLTAKEYLHLALANIADAGTVTLDGDEMAQTSKLTQAKGDTIDSHATGVFTARDTMTIRENEDQSFFVNLYMANSAAAIVIDTTGYKVRDIRTYINKVGDGFMLCDSVYTYTSDPIIRMNDVPVPGTNSVCRYGVCFPSKPEGKWEIRCYVTLEDGTITENIITVDAPLLPGNLKVINAKLGNNGVFEVINSEASVSVTLDWKSGGTYNPSL